MTVSLSELETLIHSLLRKEYSEEDTRLIAEVLLYGEMAGRPSHGLLRLLPNSYGVFVPHERKQPTYTRKTPVSTMIDGGGNPGMLIGPLAMKEVIDLAKKQGIGLVGTKGSVHTTGALSYYCSHIAAAGYIGCVFSHSSPFVAPFNLKESVFGTNPLAFGIPADPDPFIFDMSTAATTFGAIAQYKLKGQQLPPHLAIAPNGEETTNPDEALAGAILTFDHSYKGSGLAMVVEILSAVMTGSSFAGVHEEDGWGNLFVAFSPNLLSDLATLKSRMNEFLTALQNTPTRDNIPLRIPGMTTQERYRIARETGSVAIADETLAKVRALAAAASSDTIKR